MEVKKNNNSLYYKNYSKDSFYDELTSRNNYFIKPQTQANLKNLRILIAGCGSTGGACIESLARVGVTKFILADNGEYELSNLNRQHARLSSLDKNKAIFHKEELLEINPFIDCQVEANGVTWENVHRICSDVDIIFDAVDVTTPQGIEAKILLHERAQKLKKPVLAALDLGFCQWGCSYDYRNNKKKLLDGRIEKIKKAKHPIKALFTIFPLSIVPNHCLDFIDDLLSDKLDYASQLGSTSDTLSAVIVPSIIKFVDTGELVKGWNINFYSIVSTSNERLFLWLKSFKKRRHLNKKLKHIS